MEAKQRSHSGQAPEGRWLEVEETRLVCDLRIMHSKVTELYQVVSTLKQRHHEADILKYADHDGTSKEKQCKSANLEKVTWRSRPSA